MSEEEWINIAAAAERRDLFYPDRPAMDKGGELSARKERSIGRDGRWVIKTWIRVSDLDDVFRTGAHEEYVRKIRATAKPFTVEQKVALRKVFLAHLLDREAKRKRARIGGATAKCGPGGVLSRAWLKDGQRRSCPGSVR